MPPLNVDAIPSPRRAVWLRMLLGQGARPAATGGERENQMRAALGEQATLLDKLQTARDLRDAAGEARSLGTDLAAAEA